MSDRRPRYDFSRFEGYAPPRYTQIPDELLDFHMAELTHAELRCLLYIARKTFGYRKDSDAISLSQMVDGTRSREGGWHDLGTGLSRRAVVYALRSLEEKALIEIVRTETELGDAAINQYRLRVQAGERPGGNPRTPSSRKRPPVVQPLHHPDAPGTPPLVQPLHYPEEQIAPPLVQPVNAQESTRQKTTKQETTRQRVAALSASSLAHIAGEYGTTSRDQRALETFLSRWPASVVEEAVVQLEKRKLQGEEIRNESAYLTSLVPAIARKHEEASARDEEETEERVLLLHATAAFYEKGGATARTLRQRLLTDFPGESDLVERVLRERRKRQK